MRRTVLRLVLPLVAGGVIGGSASSAAAGWPEDPATNLGVCEASSQQTDLVSCGDDAGGIILAWSDRRGGDADIYVQRIGLSGLPQWTPGGLRLCHAPFDQTAPAITADGAGGAIVVWQDQRSGVDGDLWAQRIGPDGTPQWTADGVPVCTAANDQLLPRVVTDGQQGAFVVWDDNRAADGGTPYTQRLTAEGQPAWLVDGFGLGDPDPINVSPPLFVAYDLAGGEIVAWKRRIQRVNAGGGLQWSPGGNIIAGWDIQGVSADSTGGAVAAGISANTIYGQRVNAGGQAQWGVAGIPVADTPGRKRNMSMCCDSVGSMVIAWHDERAGAAGDIYLQRVTPAGLLPWGNGGRPVCTAASAQDFPTVATDVDRGVLVCWVDLRLLDSRDLFAQRVSFGGAPLWTLDGVAVTTAPHDQGGQVVMSDGQGGMFAAWVDFRNDGGDVFGQWLDFHGVLGGSPAGVPGARHGGVTLERPAPDPAAGPVQLAFTLPRAGAVRLDVLDAAGRRVRTLLDEVRPAGAHRLMWDGRDAAGRRAPPGVYLVRLAAESDQRVRRIVRID
jgi:flagellar hook capping protein FlgD